MARLSPEIPDVTTGLSCLLCIVVGILGPYPLPFTDDKPVSDSRLGDDVHRSIRVGLNFPSQLRNEHPDILWFVLLGQTPHLP